MTKTALPSIIGRRLSAKINWPLMLESGSIRNRSRPVFMPESDSWVNSCARYAPMYSVPSKQMCIRDRMRSAVTLRMRASE